MPTITLDQILGPLGLTIGAIVALWAFATERVAPGSRVRRLESLVERFASLSETSTATLTKMSDALEERNSLDEQLLLRLARDEKLILELSKKRGERP